MKKSWWILLVILFCPVVFACDTPLDGKVYTASQNFCGKRYYIPDGIVIETDNIVIDCNNGILQGDFKGTGVLVKDADNVVIKNCNIVNYHRGIHLKNVNSSDIFDTNLLRNFIGLRIENTNENHLYGIRDVSITKVYRAIHSFSNHIKYVNKDIEGDFCGLDLKYAF